MLRLGGMLKQVSLGAVGLINSFVCVLVFLPFFVIIVFVLKLDLPVFVQFVSLEAVCLPVFIVISYYVFVKKI